MIKKRLGKSNLEVSCVGFGSYRISNKIEQHHHALEKALKKGINLIDTSSNYADGESEILIGNLISRLISTNEFRREDLIIVTKGGYIQGQNLQLVNQRVEIGSPYNEIVICSPDLKHSINPEFLEDQINLSLQRLKMDCIDVYLLHNPEYFLTYTKMNSLTDLRNEYYKRIETAFRFLEQKVDEGKIKWYGISSNTFGANADKLNFTSLERVLEIAENISPKNHFAVVQFPLNAIEKVNASTKNQFDNTKTFLRLANEANLGVLVNRPLNGIEHNQIIRLADYEIKENISKDETIDLASQIESIEKEILILADKIEDGEIRKNVMDCLSIGNIIKSNFDRFDGVTHFSEVRNQFLIPRANYSMQNLFETFREDKSALNKINNYAVHVNILLDSCESVLAKTANEENKKLHDKLNQYLDDSYHQLSLSQKSVLMINSLSEISCTLVGMRKEEYVNDIIEITDYKPQQKAYEYWGLD